MTIKTFTCLYKMLNEKKNVYAFLIQKPLILYAGLGSKEKNFQRVSRNLSKNSVFLIKELFSV